METVGAGFRHDVDDAARHLTKFRVVIVRMDFEFFDRVDDRGDSLSTAEGPLVDDAVQQEQIAPNSSGR